MRYLEGRGLEFTEGIPPPPHTTYTHTNKLRSVPTLSHSALMTKIRDG